VVLESQERSNMGIKRIVTCVSIQRSKHTIVGKIVMNRFKKCQRCRPMTRCENLKHENDRLKVGEHTEYSKSTIRISRIS
jgi:hypothetical protein